MENNSEVSVTKSLGFHFLQNVVIQVASFAIQILLARILCPDDYGVLSIVLVFINLANVFTTSGYGNALIQKKNSDVYDFSTIFLFTLFLSLILSAGLFFASPLIGQFYSNDQLDWLIKASIILLPLSSIMSIQEAYLKIQMEIKKIFYINVFSLLSSWTVGLILAYNGFGVWSLLIHQILYKLVAVILYFIFSKMKIVFYFSFERLKSLLSFGSKLLFASLIVNIYEEVRGLIVAKKYSTEQLGFFNRGKQFPMTIVNSINSSIQGVMYTVFSKKQDDIDDVRQCYKKVIQCSSFIVFPICFGLACTSKNVVLLLLTSKWLPCTPFLIMFCFYYIFWPIRETSQQVMSSLGRSDLFLKVEIVQKIIGIIILVSTMFINVYAIAIGMIIDGIISTIINSIIVGKQIKYSVFNQLKDIFLNFSIAAVMGIICSLLYFLKINYILMLILQIFLGVIIYFGLSFASHNNSLILCLDLFIRRNRKHAK